MGMRISADEYRALPLIAHTVLEGVPLRDVSAIDLPGGGNRSVADVLSLLSGSEASGGIASALMRVRETVGRWLHWDDATPAAPSRFWDRVPANLRRPPSATDSGAFRLMYQRPDEALSEIRNATVHAFLCTVLQRRPDGYRLYWAVYVLPVSWFTPVYMAVIEPFRRFLVYPSLLRRLRREWGRRYAADPRP